MEEKRPSSASKRQKSSNGEMHKAFALLVIDEAPIRKAALKAYQRAERQVARAGAKIEVYESSDLPAFCRWEAQLFGPLMSEIRDLSLVLQERAHLLAIIDEEVMFTRCSRLAAYQRVMEARTNPSPPLADRSDSNPKSNQPPDDETPKVFGHRHLPPDFDIDVYDKLSRREQKEIYEYYEDAALMFEMTHGIPAPRFEDLIEEERERRRTTSGNSPPPIEEEIPRIHFDAAPPVAGREWARIKELYRTLVRRLHPDMGGAQSTRERELWQQVQDAYHARDLDWLESIHGRTEALHQGGASLSIQMLRRLTEDLLRAMTGLRAQVTKLRRHPGWRFHEKTNALARFEERRRRRLERDLAAKRKKLERIERILGNLATRASRSSKSKKAGDGSSSGAVR